MHLCTLVHSFLRCMDGGSRVGPRRSVLSPLRLCADSVRTQMRGLRPLDRRELLMSAGRTVTPATMTRRQRWTALVILAGSLLVVMMDMTILIMALPALVADLGASADEQLWIVDIYSLFLAGLLIPMSAIADRWGRKKTLLCG